MNLEPVSRALAEHLSAGGAAAAREAARGTAPEALGCLFVGVFAVLLGLLLMAFLPGKAFKFAGIASALIGLVAVLISALSLRSTNNAAAEAPTDALDAGGAEHGAACSTSRPSSPSRRASPTTRPNSWASKSKTASRATEHAAFA